MIALVVLNGSRQTYKNWFRAVRSFYFIALVFLVIFIIIAIFGLVWGLLKSRTWMWVFALWIIVISIIIMIFAIRLYESMKLLYTPPEAKNVKQEIGKDPNYGTAKPANAT